MENTNRQKDENIHNSSFDKTRLELSSSSNFGYTPKTRFYESAKNKWKKHTLNFLVYELNYFRKI